MFLYQTLIQNEFSHCSNLLFGECDQWYFLWLLKEICQNNVFPKFVFILSDIFKLFFVFCFFCIDASIVAETVGVKFVTLSNKCFLVFSL